MKIKLVTSRKETPEGFPLVVEIAHQNKRIIFFGQFLYFIEMNSSYFGFISVKKMDSLALYFEF